MDSEVCFYRKVKNQFGEIDVNYCIAKECFDRKSIEGYIIQKNDPFGVGYSGAVYDVCDASSGNCDRALKIIPLSTMEEAEYTHGSITYDCNPLDTRPLRGQNRSVNSDCISTTIDHFQKEVEVASLAGEIGVSPKIYDSWICEGVRLKIHTDRDIVSDEAKDWKDDSQILGFILMEKLHGETLEDFVKMYPEIFVGNFYRLLSDGIDKALKLESCGFRHRDLGPKNIFVIGKGTGIRFLDFADVDPFPETFRNIKRLFTMNAFIEEMMLCLEVALDEK